MLFALVAAAASMLGASISHADTCSALRSQMLSSGRSAGVGPELAQLRRQLAAIQGIERQRRCGASSSGGGFFNACADLAKSRSEVQRRIAGIGNAPGRDVSGLQARFVALGCAPAAKPQRQQDRAASTLGGNAMLFCVRLSDGYFFPAPKSQFAKGNDLKAMADQCRYICDDANVDLYTLDDPSVETDQMVALETRKPYTELPTAFRYRDDASFKACDVRRYSERVAELRARTVTPANMANAIIPLPTGKPDLGRVAEIPAGAAGVNEPKDPEDTHPEAMGAAQQSVEKLAGERPVRTVGPAFFPQN